MQAEHTDAPAPDRLVRFCDLRGSSVRPVVHDAAADRTSFMQQPNTRRAVCTELLARVLLTIGALLPYWPLLGFDTLHVTDDGFMSDIWNGELPTRVLMGAALREHGSVPSWTSQICSGTPLVGGEEPLSLLLFSRLPVAPALDALLIAWLLIAAHGAYFLARRARADRPGAVLAGIAFAVSGYLVTQLKHLAIISTVVWLPLGLGLLDRALAQDRDTSGASAAPTPARARDLALFALVFGEQALGGFPQSLYICALCYGAFALFRVGINAPRRVLLPLMAAACAVGLGALLGAVTLLPLAELARSSDRAVSKGFAWATQTHYWPGDAIMFLLPYANGDISNATYHAPALFWEDYGYVGLATFVLALYAVVRAARLPYVRFFAALTFAAYLLVLGPATPVFRWAFELLPGLSNFRFSTRFLVVVDLGLCVLAAVGLTQLSRTLAARVTGPRAQRLVSLLALVVCLGTELDLFIHQPRQNPFVRAADWLAPPGIVDALRAEGPFVRVFTPFHMKYHLAANGRARNWVTTQPYFALGELLQPNSNLYWNVASADCYAGLGPRWYVDAWGDHNREGQLVYLSIRPSARPMQLETDDVFPALMRAFGVTHIISPYSIAALEPAVPFAQALDHGTHLYRVPGAARVRVVPRAVVAASEGEVAFWLHAPRFDPEAYVILTDAPKELATPVAALESAATSGHATLERDEGEHVIVRAEAPPGGGFLVVSDTFFPGWTARVDGKPAPIYRANLYVRAVPLAAGAHRVELRYASSARVRGFCWSLAALTVLLGVLASALFFSRRARTPGRPAAVRTGRPASGG